MFSFLLVLSVLHLLLNICFMARDDLDFPHSHFETDFYNYNANKKRGGGRNYCLILEEKFINTCPGF